MIDKIDESSSRPCRLEAETSNEQLRCASMKLRKGLSWAFSSHVSLRELMRAARRTALKPRLAAFGLSITTVPVRSMRLDDKMCLALLTLSSLRENLTFLSSKALRFFDVSPPLRLRLLILPLLAIEAYSHEARDVFIDTDLQADCDAAAFVQQWPA